MLKILNTYIDTKSIIKRGVADLKDKWGVYFITGYQGTGKTYFSVYYLYNFISSKKKIYTNIKSLKIKGRDISYFTKLDEILTNYEINAVFVVDEVSKKYDRTSKPDKPFYSWLQQSRKRKRIVLLISQEWKEIPPWLRRPARFIYTTNKLPFINIYKTVVGDAQNLVLDAGLDWVCPKISTFYHKKNKYVCSSYDTLEPIDTL